MTESTKIGLKIVDPQKYTSDVKKEDTTEKLFNIFNQTNSADGKVQADNVLDKTEQDNVFAKVKTAAGDDGILSDEEISSLLVQEGYFSDVPEADQAEQKDSAVAQFKKFVSGLFGFSELKQTSVDTTGAPKTVTKNTETGAYQYEVKSGDTLLDIIKDNYGDLSKEDKQVIMSEIQKRNPQIEDPNLIYTGDKYDLPVAKFDENGKVTGFYTADEVKADQEASPETVEGNSTGEETSEVTYTEEEEAKIASLMDAVGISREDAIKQLTEDGKLGDKSTEAINDKINELITSGVCKDKDEAIALLEKNGVEVPDDLKKTSPDEIAAKVQQLIDSGVCKDEKEAIEYLQKNGVEIPEEITDELNTKRYSEQIEAQIQAIIDTTGKTRDEAVQQLREDDVINPEDMNYFESLGESLYDAGNKFQKGDVLGGIGEIVSAQPKAIINNMVTGWKAIFKGAGELFHGIFG